MGVLLFVGTTFVLDLVAFCVALSTYPYSAGCDTSSYSGCTTLKAAIGLDGALWSDFNKYPADLGRILILLGAIFSVFSGSEVEVTEVIERRGPVPRPFEMEISEVERRQSVTAPFATSPYYYS